MKVHFSPQFLADYQNLVPELQRATRDVCDDAATVSGIVASRLQEVSRISGSSGHDPRCRGTIAIEQVPLLISYEYDIRLETSGGKVNIDEVVIFRRVEEIGYLVSVCAELLAAWKKYLDDRNSGHTTP